MKNFKRKLSAIALSTIFATMQVSFASTDIGLGSDHGGAVIDSHSGGLVNIDGVGTSTVDLNFNANTHVKWDTLNVDNGETLNFNAVGGANGLTILNTVQNNMTGVYGQINANSGIGQLIISNPNGVFFDGAKFMTAADCDLTVTTQNMSNLSVNDLSNAKFSQLYDSSNNLIPVRIINNSDFNVGGDYTIIAPLIDMSSSKITANTLKLVTANGQDYVQLSAVTPVNNKGVTFLEAMNIDGDVVITNDVGAMTTTKGGTINGNLTVNTAGNTILNKEDGNQKLIVNGDTNITSKGVQTFFRNADVAGDLNVSSSGGFVDVGNVNVDGDANLTTTGVETRAGH